MENNIVSLITQPSSAVQQTNAHLEQPHLIGNKNALFSTRRPVNAISGVSSGLKSMSKGIIAGVATVLAAPVVGAKSEGVKGFFGGLLAGILGGCALITSGVGVGTILMQALTRCPEVSPTRPSISNAKKSTSTGTLTSKSGSSTTCKRTCNFWTSLTSSF